MSSEALCKWRNEKEFLECVQIKYVNEGYLGRYYRPWAEHYYHEQESVKSWF